MSEWTQERIERERALCEAASTPPWKADIIANAGENWMLGAIIDLGRDRYENEWIVTTDHVHASELDSDAKADAAFIAAARTGYPSALAEIELLQGENKNLSDRNFLVNQPRCSGMDEEETGDPCQFCGARLDGDGCRDMADTAHLHAEIERQAARIAELRAELSEQDATIKQLQGQRSGLKDSSTVEVNMLRGDIAVPPKRDRDRTERMEALLRKCLATEHGVASWYIEEELAAKISAELEGRA